MTHKDTLDSPSTTATGSGYYAVNAERVIQVFSLFNMRPSHFMASGQAGAHKLYYDAKKIIDGTSHNQWGHHTQKSIQAFCQFTQMSNDCVVPWQELIEHEGDYDGKEGSSPRTGNKLLTEIRLNINHQAVIEYRNKTGMSVREIAQQASIPALLLEAIENDQWKTVTEHTTRSLAEALATEPDNLCIPVSINDPESVTQENSARQQRAYWLPVSILVFLFIIAAVYFLMPQDKTRTDFSNQRYCYATITPINDDIVIEASLKALLAKGAFIHMREDGQLGFNWSTSNDYLYPETHRWSSKADKLFIVFGDISYTFDLDDQKNNLVTYSNQGGLFKMVIKRVSR